MHLIGLAGKARSGKDTAARYIVKKHGYARVAFADPVKEAAAGMFGISINYFYDDDLKEEPHPFWGISPREMVQKVGTECARQVFGDDIWIRRAQLELQRIAQYNEYAQQDKYVKAIPGVVMSDVRYENEAAWIRDSGGIIIHIQRDAVSKVRGHSSENGVACDAVDYRVFNGTTVESFCDSMEGLLRHIERYGADNG